MIGAFAAWRSVLVALALGASAVAAAVDVPYLSGRIVDHAEILQRATRERLGALLAAHEAATGNEIVVLTVPTLEGESIEGYATRVFDTWKLGKKGRDNGVLLIVAPQDRRLRIEVGYGLEGTLTDVAASRIIRDVITPAFKAGDYDRGVGDGIAAIVAALEGRAASPAEAAPPAAKVASRSFDEFEQDLPPWPMRILLGAFIFGVIGLFTVIGVMTPGVGWFLYVFLIPFWAMFPIIVVGVKGALALLGVYAVGFPLAKLLVSRQPWYAKAKHDLKTTGHANVGGFTMTTASGRSSGSWSSGGGSSGGGSSGGGSSGGGGGSSGGGGASGSW